MNKFEEHFDGGFILKTIICHNQEEFNEAIKKKNALIVLQDTTERIIVSVEAWGNSSVVAWENSSVNVSDNSHVLVIGEINNREFKQYDNGSIKKYIDIKYDKSVLDRFKKENGKQILYKSVNPKTDCDFYTGNIKYAIGEEVIAPDFDPNPNIECGNGLHLCFNAITTQHFNKGKILKCLVDPEDIVVYSGNIEKVRCRKVVPVAIVDKRGNVI